MIWLARLVVQPAPATSGTPERRPAVPSRALLIARSDPARGDQGRPPPTEADLEVLRGQIADAVAHGTFSAKKALVGTMVHESRVTNREQIIPVFRVPNAQPGGQVREL